MTCSVCGAAGARRRALRFSAIVALCGLVFGGVLTPQAKAAFIGQYSSVNFTVTTSAVSDGFAEFANDGSSLTIVGPNSAGVFGTIDVTTAAPVTGNVQFDFSFMSYDLPGFDYGGYLLDSVFYPFLTDVGTEAFAVSAGEVFGWRIVSEDSQGGEGVLMITNFSGPEEGSAIPEPGNTSVVLIGGAVVALFGLRRTAWRVRFGRVSRQLMMFTCIGAVTAAGLFGQSQVYYSASNVTGDLVWTRVVNLRQQAQTLGVFQTFGLSNRASETTPKMPPKRLKPPPLPSPILNQSIYRRGDALNDTRAAAGVSSFAVTAAAATSLQVVGATGATGFNALSHRDQRLANNGNQWSIEPPSQNIAVANGYVVEGVNDAIQVFDTAGNPALPTTVSTNQLYGLSPSIVWSTGYNGVYLTDMRVYFDTVFSRWLILQRAQDQDLFGFPLPQSHLYLAVSKTEDPTGDYNIYVMDTTNSSHPGCPCIADYPQVGSDQYGFHITWNEYNINEQFLDAVVLSVSKSGLASGVATPNAVKFTVPYVTGFEFALQPATTPPGSFNFLGSGGLEYFASTLPTSSGSRMAIWAMYNTSSLALTTPNPVLTRIIVPTLNYIVPGPATQPPGPTPYGSSLGRALEYLDGGDCRVQTLSYAFGRLYLTLQTSIIDETGRAVVGGAYAVFSPTYRGSVLAASVVNQGYLFVTNNHILRPAIAVNSRGRGAIGATLVGPDWYPSVAVIPIDTFSTPSTIEVAVPGALPEDGFTGYNQQGGGVARWGDYNAAVATSDGAIWMCVQYIGDYPRTEAANWNTYVLRKQP